MAEVTPAASGMGKSGVAAMSLPGYLFPVGGGVGRAGQAGIPGRPRVARYAHI
jgi:hypothetical protein